MTKEWFGVLGIMSRPQRIEFENAYYHVMNRGAGRCDIFHDVLDREQFLSIVYDAHKQFGIEIHAYCLMDNHYHLLIKTPRANLGRAMRHINGVYTQRYNRKNNTDGPLFRGRYKAIVVDSDAYLLHLSKYIHLNPLSAKLVEVLEEYSWSSYNAYIGKSIPPNWLNQSEIYDQVTSFSNKAEHYRLFMSDLEVNESLIEFYSKQRLSPVLGDDLFISKLDLHNFSEENPRQDRLSKSPTIMAIVTETAIEFGKSIDALLSLQKGRGRKNMPRKVAMYIAQKFGDYRLKEIAVVFGLSHYGGVAHAVSCVVDALKLDENLLGKINAITNRLGL